MRRSNGLTVLQLLVAILEASTSLDQEVFGTVGDLELTPNLVPFSMDSDEQTESVLLCFTRANV